MLKRHFIIIEFVRTLAYYVLHVWELILSLVLLMVIGGVAISKVEGITLGDGIYFACVTGLTVGYGDIHPVTSTGRILSIIIALVGLLFTGLTVAVATRALADTAKHIRENKS